MSVTSASLSFNSNPITASYALNVTCTVVGDVPVNGYRKYFFKKNGTTVQNYTSNTQSKTYSLTATQATNGTKWKCVINDYVYDPETGEYSLAAWFTTPELTLFVYWLPSLSATSPSTVTKGVGKTVTFSSSVSASGNPSSGYVYQWQVSTDGTNYSDISGETSLLYTTPALTIDENGNIYRLKVTRSGVSGAKYSTPATLTVSDIPVLTVPSGLQVSVNPLTQDNVTLSWTKSSDSTEIVAQSDIAYNIEATLTSDTGWTSPFYQVTTAANAASKTDNLRATILDPQSDTLLSGQYAYGAYKFRVRATADYDYNGDETDETYTSEWTELTDLTYDYRIVPSASSVTLPGGDIYEGQTISVTWGRPTTYNAYDEDGTANVLTYYTKTAFGLTLAKKWSGSTEVPITGNVSSATVTESVIVENITNGSDLATTVYTYCKDTENQTGANSSSQNITIKRHRAPVISVVSDTRAETTTELLVEVTDTGYGGSQTNSQIYSFEYSLDGTNWTEVLHDDATWSTLRATFDVEGLTAGSASDVYVRALNTAPNDDTPRVTGNYIEYAVNPYKPIAYVYTSDTESGLQAQHLRVGKDFATGYEVYHEGNLKQGISREPDYKATLASAGTNIANIDLTSGGTITINANDKFYIEIDGIANSTSSTDIKMGFNGVALSTANYESLYQYGASSAHGANIVTFGNSTTLPFFTSGDITKVQGYRMYIGSGKRGSATQNLDLASVRLLTTDEISSIQITAANKVKAGAEVRIWRV